MTTINQAAAILRDALQKIVETRFGDDGDCGVVRIAEDALYEAERAAIQPAGDAPVLWVESEPSTRLLDLAEIINGTCHTVMYHTTEPRTSNPVWPLYERAQAAPVQAAPDAGPTMNQMIALMREAATVAPNLTTVEPIPLTPVQVAWIVGKVRSASPAVQAAPDAANEAAISAAMTEGNAHGVKSTVAARIVAAYLSAPAVQAAPVDTPERCFPNSSGRDWAEDFPHENGNYMCNCSTCGKRFFGHKRRTTCKLCVVAPEVKASELPPLPAPLEWNDGEYTTDHMRAYGQACIAADRAARASAELQLRHVLSAATSEMGLIHQALGLDPAAPLDAMEMVAAIQRMRSAFHINMLRAYPSMSHAEIAAAIDKACGIDARSPVAAPDLTGMEVSMDVSTGDEDGAHRIFGRVDSMQAGTDGKPMILAVEESRNFAPVAAPQPDVSARDAGELKRELSAAMSGHTWLKSEARKAGFDCALDAILAHGDRYAPADMRTRFEVWATTGDRAGPGMHRDSHDDYRDNLVLAWWQAWQAATKVAAGPAAPESAEPSAAARDVLAERKRQIDAEGWTPEHDDKYRDDELSMAAVCYANTSGAGGCSPNGWPWPEEWWKPSTARRNLVKAGALIIAEVERIDRLATSSAAKGASDGNLG